MQPPQIWIQPKAWLRDVAMHNMNPAGSCWAESEGAQQEVA